MKSPSVKSNDQNQVFDVRVAAEGRFLEVAVDGVGVTQANSWAEVEEVARDLVAIMLEIDPIVVDLQIVADINSTDFVRTNETISRLESIPGINDDEDERKAAWKALENKRNA